ncbi:MAG: hypothetical protein HOF33_09195 [Rhodospirillaceae bacterium]|nr:hypothetical protein [Rhodospirillaceae bacterium]MBT4428074.1 hypothetical protein [Rhodospirillaceae bacterium]
MTRAYRLSVDPSAAAFQPEIDYVFSVLERYYPLRRAGPEETDAPLLRYGAADDGADVAVPGVLFPNFVEVREADGIFLLPGAVEHFLAADGGLLPPAPERGDSGGALSYDAIGLAFLMLSLIEERECPAPDRYGRYPAAETFAVRAGLHGVPLADRALEDIARRLLHPAAASHLSTYEVVPTHDVDRLKAYHWLHEPLRYALGDALKRGHPVQGLRRLKAYGAGQPERSFEWLMGLSERHGLISHFYFMAPSHNSMDSTYARHWPALMRRMAERARGRGHEVGFHPGFMSFDNADEWQRQKADLERIIGGQVKEGRHHVLRYAADTTPRLWSDAGMAVDHTPSFPEVSGFRTGSTRRYQAFDLYGRRALKVDQCATAVMEFALFGGKYRDLSVEQALAVCRPLIAECRRYGGRFVILQHTGVAAPIVRTFYEHLLEEAV